MSGLALAFAASMAFLMGASIQRGATCLVVAVDQLIFKRNAARLFAILEAGLFVSVGLIVSSHFMALPHLPASIPVSGRTVLGGVFLGVGAAINGGCVFGTLVRLGGGELEFVWSVVSFFFGCLLFAALDGAQVMPQANPIDAVAMTPRSWLTLVLILGASAILMARLMHLTRPALQSAALEENGVPARPFCRFLENLSPHFYTVMIGIFFLLLFVVIGDWAYTSTLAQWASAIGQAQPLALDPGLGVNLLLMAMLFGGTIAGGYFFRKNRQISWRSGRKILACVLGGALMGLGGMLTPGSNDSLLLAGMPLFLPHAWVALPIMTLSIAGSLMLKSRFFQ
jgi:toxin CptA